MPTLLSSRMSGPAASFDWPQVNTGRKSPAAGVLSTLHANRAALADACGKHDVFPTRAIDILRQAGALTAPLPRNLGGCGWGSQAGNAELFQTALQLLGAIDLSLGRIYEAHINAVLLVHRYGSRDQIALLSEDLKVGHLFGLWVTGSSRSPISLRGDRRGVRASGMLRYCTAAGFATRALVLTDDGEGGAKLLLIDATRVVVDEEPIELHGMRLTHTRQVRLDMPVTEAAFVGEPGDYLREPTFSGGAWRTSAVTVGGLEALVRETARQLLARDRHRDPHQLARLGDMLIARQTAGMWVRAAAERAEAAETTEGVVAFVNLARLAVEKACLDVIPLVQRSLGLACMLRSNPVEVRLSDLATYLRQPAGDEALVEAAAWFVDTECAGDVGPSP
jgi:alkylation response protein AidB-like acyl-CoA dehydrogenase